MWRRLALDVVVTFAVAGVAVLVGRRLGPELGVWLVRSTGIAQIVVRSPADFEFSGLGAAFVLPVVVSGIGGVSFRLRRRAAPSPLYLVGIGAVVAIAIGAWLALRVNLFADIPVAPGGIQPMISLDSFEFPRAAWEAGVVTGVLLCGLPWLMRAVRPRTPAPSSATRTP